MHVELVRDDDPKERESDHRHGLLILRMPSFERVGSCIGGWVIGELVFKVAQAEDQLDAMFPYMLVVVSKLVDSYVAGT